MTEEKMQGEARQAFLVNTLQKLLGQDSPTGFTERVVTVAEEIARELGFDAHRTNKGNLVITVPGRESGHKVGALRPCGYPGPDGAFGHRGRHADGHQGRRPAAAHPGR